MISTVSWVRKGFAKKTPEKFQLSKEEYDNICAMTRDNLNLAASDLAVAEAGDDDIDVESSQDIAKKDSKSQSDIPDNDDDLAEYNLDDYDNEAVQEPNLFHPDTAAEKDQDEAINEDNDPYITIPDENDEFDRDDEEIRENDLIFLVGKTEDDLSKVEVYVFDTEDETLFVHHDFLLPSLPLCLEPINYEIKGSKNWCAVATFESSIELWNLDMIDAICPDFVLGGDGVMESVDGSSEKKKKNKKQKKVMSNKADLQSHSDAVLSLSWNKNAPNFLLSASADTSLILWDLNSMKCMKKFSHHSSKVSSVSWHPTQSSFFISAGYDRKIFLVDAKLNEGALGQAVLDSDIECMSWDLHSISDATPFGSFVVGTDSGHVEYFSIASDHSIQKTFSLSAYSSSLTSVCVHPHIPGFLLTTAAESSEQTRIWDFYGNTYSNGQLQFKTSLLESKDLGLGKVYCSSVCEDNPYYVVVGGSSGEVAVWNVTDTKSIKARFHGRQGRSGVVRMDLEDAIVEVSDSTDKIDEDLSESDSIELEETIEEMKGIKSGH